MKRNTLYLLLILWLPSYSYADYWNSVLVATCNQDKNQFIINYYGSYDPISPEVYSKTQNTCELSDGKYEFKPNYFPGSKDGSGACGSYTYKEILITHNGKVIFSSLVVKNCHDAKDHISSVTISPGSPIKVERKPGFPSDY